MPHQTRDTSGFTPASHQSQALCLGTLGAAALLAPATQWGFEPPRLLAAWAVAGGGVWLMSRARRHWRLHEMEDILLGRLEGGVPAALELRPEFLEKGRPHPQLQRIAEIIAGSKYHDMLELDQDKVEISDDGGQKVLVSWGLKSVKTGGLSQDRVQKDLRELFKNSLHGFWRISFDTVSDTMFGTQVDDLPKLCFPPRWPVAKSVEEAQRMYTGWRIHLGLTHNDEVVSTSVWDYPHMKVIGETNSGKSVAVKSILEQMRAAGWMLIIGDGKGVDFNGFNAADPDNHYLPPPGTIAYGSGRGKRTMTYIAAVVIAYNMVLERLEVEGAALDRGEDPEPFPPVFILLDEIKALRERWVSELDKEEYAEVDHMISQIAAVGRGSRIHLGVVSQDAYRDSIPRNWVSNVRMSLVVGRPTTNTVTNSFDDALVRDKVKDVREMMSPSDKGRCIVARVDEISGKADVAQYQNYFSYSPGASWSSDNIPAGTAEAWSAFKSEVSDRVPRMYSRVWFKIDGKSEAQLLYEEESGEDMGYVDFDMFTVSEIKRMKRINLDFRNEEGEIVPNPEYAKYDPNSPLYICKPTAGAGRKYVNPVL